METAFFVASKLVWGLVRPESLLFVLMVTGTLALLAGRNRLALGLVAISATTYGLVGVVPLHTLLFRPLEARFPSEPVVSSVSGIVVLGGTEDLAATSMWGMPQLTDGDRYLTAIALAREYPGALLMFAGGGARLDPQGAEASIAKALFASAGIAPERLVFESHSRNTAENARLARELAPAELSGAWLLITSAAHMPRAVGAFCAAGWSGFTPWPTDYHPASLELRWNPAGNLAHLDSAVREWLGLFAYWLTGRSTELFPDGCDSDARVAQG